jgi:hypothetical protein
MSELIQKNDNRATIRWKLLTGASALVFATYVSSAGMAKAEDASHPPIWLELDGQFAQQQTGIELYSPPFMSESPFDGISHLGLEKAAPTIWDKSAKITFQPERSDWILSLSARYGKIGRSETREGHPTIAKSKYSGPLYSAYQHFSAQSSEGHFILDFQVGKDVGIGRFGSDGSSIVSAGVRIAQFNSRNHVDIKSQPTNLPTGTYVGGVNRFYASFAAKRRFTGVGPSLSWDASANIAGNPADSAISLDWGVNGAVLFGRQRAEIHHHTSRAHFLWFSRTFAYQISSAPPARSRNVTVPNLGGFAGVSWRYAAAKVTLGYRADYFFGAIDGGIDAAKKEDRGFYGPFVSISVGIGD